MSLFFYSNQIPFVWQNPTQKLKRITQKRKAVLQLNTPLFRSACIDFQLQARTRKKYKLTIKNSRFICIKLKASVQENNQTSHPPGKQTKGNTIWNKAPSTVRGKPIY